MYVHIDTRNYGAARVGVLTSDTVDGDYKWVKSFRPFAAGEQGHRPVHR